MGWAWGTLSFLQRKPFTDMQVVKRVPAPIPPPVAMNGDSDLPKAATFPLSLAFAKQGVQRLCSWESDPLSSESSQQGRLRPMVRDSSGRSAVVRTLCFAAETRQGPTLLCEDLLRASRSTAQRLWFQGSQLIQPGNLHKSCCLCPHPVPQKGAPLQPVSEGRLTDSVSSDKTSLELRNLWLEEARCRLSPHTSLTVAGNCPLGQAECPVTQHVTLRWESTPTAREWWQIGTHGVSPSRVRGMEPSALGGSSATGTHTKDSETTRVAARSLSLA